jgi:hypothetical protein
MTLSSQILTDSTTVFLRSDDFAETVTYYPYRFFGQPDRADRVIKAQVFREQIGVIVDGSDAITYVWVVHVHNSSTTGIAAAEIDIRQDRIGFPLKDGESAPSEADAKVIHSIIQQDAGMLILEVR